MQPGEVVQCKSNSRHTENVGRCKGKRQEENMVAEREEGREVRKLLIKEIRWKKRKEGRHN